MITSRGIENIAARCVVRLMGLFNDMEGRAILREASEAPACFIVGRDRAKRRGQKGDAAGSKSGLSRARRAICGGPFVSPVTKANNLA